MVTAIITSGALAQKAPNFTITDTDGNNWNLHEELGKGRTVILDFFFVDCQPCSTWTPEIVKLYKDYGAGDKDILILGISDRDEDEYIEGFENHLNTNYPSAGIDGGGDTVTRLYKSWFPFKGWPTYSVICPDTGVVWNVDRTKDLPALRKVLDSCLKIKSSVQKLDFSRERDILLFPNPTTDVIHISFPNELSKSTEIQITSLTGHEMPIGIDNYSNNLLTLSTSHLASGYYILCFTNTRSNIIRKTFLIQ